MSAPSNPQVGASPPSIALGVTGSVAAFKAVELARALLQQGSRVLPVLTRSGARFVAPMTFTALCGEPARTDMWDDSFPGELHIELAKRADIVVVAPATADFLARIAAGRADDLLAALVLVARGPVLVAPAMHPRMWAHPATQRNVDVIRRDGRVRIVGPVVGPVANGEVGLGRMAEPSEIVAEVGKLLSPRDLQALHIVVTAGPTVEDLDPVRFLTNRSSGRMGFAIAERAAQRGARVTLVTGPVSLPTPSGVDRIDVRSALQMQAALREAMGPSLASADVLVMSAAVGDYRPARTHGSKMKRAADAIALELVPNPDLLADIASQRASGRPLLVGFAVETGTDDEVIAYARGKLVRKRVDMVIANAASDGFGGDTNRASIVEQGGEQRLGQMSKHALADRILDRVRERLGAEG